MRKILNHIHLMAIAMILLTLFSCDEVSELEGDPVPYRPVADIFTASDQFSVWQAVRTDYSGSVDVTDYFRGFYLQLDHGIVICKINGLETWRNVTEWDNQVAILENIDDQNTAELKVLSYHHGEFKSELVIQLTEIEPGFSFLPEGMNTGFFNIMLTD